MSLEKLPEAPPPLPWNDRRTWLEIGLVLLVFVVHAAWPVPDVNEPHYLGKAIHYWNPDWVGDDFFLDSADTHKVFYFAYGWLSLVLPPVAFAWAGRLITWALLAVAWQRFSYAVVPARWWSVLTAALLVTLVEHAHMAGEWIVGGVEAKGFAYVFVLLGMEALVRGHWGRTWLLLGAASLFHVLVGGWAVVAAGVAWMLSPGERPTVRSMAPALFGGFLLSLPGLIPSLLLSRGVDPEAVAQANYIYVYQRLGHHLAPTQFPPSYVLRFLGLVFFWTLLRQDADDSPARYRLDRFVVGTLAVGLVGAAIGIWGYFEPVGAAGWLRFYWFRLVDVAVPIGVSTRLVGWIFDRWHARPQLVTVALAAAVLLPAVHLGNLAAVRLRPTVPRADAGRVVHYGAWRLACQWIAEPGNVPPDARFLTPRMAQTFKWYTGHSEVATWKDIPQDPESIVRWWNRIHRLHATGLDPPFDPWRPSLAWLGPARLSALGKLYGAGYVITRAQPRLPLPIVYRNRRYIIYRLPAIGPPADEAAALPGGDANDPLAPAQRRPRRAARGALPGEVAPEPLICTK
jgi:hypothetical protein